MSDDQFEIPCHESTGIARLPRQKEIDALRADNERLTREWEEALRLLHDSYIDEDGCTWIRPSAKAYAQTIKICREQKETAEYLLKLEQEWIDYNNQLAEDWKKEHARAEAAERKVEKLREALEPFAKAVDYYASAATDEYPIDHGEFVLGDLRRAVAALAETEKGE